MGDLRMGDFRYLLPSELPASVTWARRHAAVSCAVLLQIRRGERVPHPRHWQSFGDARLLP